MTDSTNLDSQGPGGGGVVQWVVPKRATKAKENVSKKSKPKSTTPRYDSDDYQSSKSFVNQNYQQAIDTRNVQHNQTTSVKPPETFSIDPTTCRTICVIVEQYIKELREHQEHINDARTRLLRQPQVHRPPVDDGNFIGYNDLSRLRVRDEQTKAIETIKQLTDYLRELSILKNQLEATTNLVSEDIHNKLSDVRNDIIQTLNDFVLANSDIDVPIIDPEDLNGREYDLCIDAQRSSNINRKLELARQARIPPTLAPMSDSTNVRDNNMVLVISDNNLPTQESAQLLERRKQEIQKLEMDTVELRKLFADFYNLVKIQGEQVDSIEDNLVAAAQHISEARHHLTQSRPMKGLTVLVPVTGCITGALIGGPIGLFIGGKLGGVTIICAGSLLGLLSSLGAQKCIASNVKVKHD